MEQFDVYVEVDEAVLDAVVAQETKTDDEGNEVPQDVTAREHFRHTVVNGKAYIYLVPLCNKPSRNVRRIDFPNREQLDTYKSALGLATDTTANELTRAEKDAIANVNLEEI